MRLFTRKQKIFLYDFQFGKCNICKSELNYVYEADHITPYSKGGSTSILNGQLLCIECHKRKTQMDNKFKLREWQEKGIMSFENHLDEGRNKMLAVATPGAGKTIFASKCMEMFYDKYDGNVIFIVLVPNKSLQKDWAESAYRNTNGKINISWKKPLVKGLNFGDHMGTVSCYQSVNADATQYTQSGFELAKYKGTKVMVVFDEAHHMAEENEWGQSASKMFSSCDFFLSISGTPFRTDGNKIPFFDYDENGKLEPSTSYTYKEAIRDNVCRDIIFKSSDGEIEFYSSEGEFLKTGIDLSQTESKLQSTVVNLTLDPKSEIVKDLIIASANKLNEIREGEHKNAGGIVFCKSIHHAKKIAEKFEEYTGEIPFVVHSELDDALDEIENFKKSNSKWIISVSMISEGKDIQRLRVGLWLSNITAELKLVQSLGRVLRFQKELKHDQTAYFFMPKFDYLVEWAKEIMESIDVVIEEKIKQPPKDPRSPGDSQQLFNLSQLITSETSGRHTIYDGSNISDSEMDAIHIWLKDCGVDLDRNKIPTEYFIKIYNHMKSQKADVQVIQFEQEKKYEEMDTQTLLDKRKSFATRLVGRLFYITKVDYAKINMYYNNKYRNGKTTSGNDMTLEDYDHKIKWLNDCIKKGRVE